MAHPSNFLALASRIKRYTANIKTKRNAAAWAALLVDATFEADAVGAKTLANLVPME
jgi:hypothetical protein